ncbi:unnamed protein product [Sphenostylis stenocarpa]|uniref:Uncharacterized protein n=1 Tax=Sphenostylis stenocarpa TaxID=92480 RepID=A0AA86S8T3_9FABA|nr:unnamed protein product [Sphenostylis stenocarpa]
MGCGISTLDAENAARGEHVNGDRRAMAPLIVESGVEGESLHGNSNNNNKMKPLGDEEAKDNDGSMKEKSVVERNDMKVEARAREIGGKEKRSSGDGKCCAENNVEEEFENRDDKLTVGPGSPSFREYCNDHCGNRSE